MHPDVLSLSGNIFTFANHKCVCRIETTYTEDEKEKKTLRIREDPNGSVIFAYQPEEGLVTVDAETGAIIKKGVLQELAAINYDDIDGLVHFFEEYGFFVPLTNKRLETFAVSDIFNIHRHIKYTLELMSLINMKRLNYKKIYSEICWLTFTDPIVLSVPMNNETSEAIYRSCIHNFQGYLHGQLRYHVDAKEDEALFNGRMYDGYEDPYETYTISDTVRPPETKLNASDFFEANNQDDMIADPFNQYSKVPLILPGALLNVFRFASGVNSEDKHTIDFFFHMEKEIGNICGFNRSNDVEFLKETDFTLDDVLKKAMIRVAKKTIKEEIDFNLSEMAPSYNMETMSPAWSIPDLFTALFFSLFYTKSEIETYRKCENPNCSNYFIVSTTNSRKKYCCPACANAMAQRNHRKKIKEKMASLE